MFLAKTKDKATKQFEQVFIHVDHRFNCKIHCLRKDGGSEYKMGDLFCKNKGVRRQLSEADKQTSNHPT